jgi:hypothetical protein
MHAIGNLRIPAVFAGREISKKQNCKESLHMLARLRGDH